MTTVHACRDHNSSPLPDLPLPQSTTLTLCHSGFLLVASQVESRHTETHTQRNKDTHTETHTHRDKDTHTETDTPTERDTYTHKDKDTYGETHRDTHTEK